MSRPLPWPALLLPLALAAAPACASRSVGDCDPGDPAAFDLCTFERIKDPSLTDAASAERLLAEIRDPIVRSAAAQHWIQQHPQAPAEQARRLCGYLTDLEKGACERRVNSPHLAR